MTTTSLIIDLQRVERKVKSMVAPPTARAKAQYSKQQQQQQQGQRGKQDQSIFAISKKTGTTRTQLRAKFPESLKTDSLSSSESNDQVNRTTIKAHQSRSVQQEERMGTNAGVTSSRRKSGVPSRPVTPTTTTNAPANSSKKKESKSKSSGFGGWKKRNPFARKSTDNSQKKAKTRPKLKKSLSDPSLSDYNISQTETEDLRQRASVSVVESLSQAKEKKRGFWPFRKKRKVPIKAKSMNHDHVNHTEHRELLLRSIQTDNMNQVFDEQRAFLQHQKIELEKRLHALATVSTEQELEVVLHEDEYGVSSAVQTVPQLVPTPSINHHPSVDTSSTTTDLTDQHRIILEQRAQIESLKKQLEVGSVSIGTTPSIDDVVEADWVEEMEWTLDPPHQMTGWFSGPVNSRRRPHGRGTMRFTNGDIYEGSFSNGQMFGQNAVYIWAFGDVYRGAFWNNLRHGHGETQMQGKMRYVGSYEYGKPHGYGIQYTVDGEIYHKGQWEHGQPAHRFIEFMENSKESRDSQGNSTVFPVAEDLSIIPREEMSVSRYDTNNPIPEVEKTATREPFPKSLLGKHDEHEDDASFNSSEENFGFMLYNGTAENQKTTKGKKKGAADPKKKKKKRPTKKEPSPKSMAIVNDAAAIMDSPKRRGPINNRKPPGVPQSQPMKRSLEEKRQALAATERIQEKLLQPTLEEEPNVVTPPNDNSPSAPRPQAGGYTSVGRKVFNNNGAEDDDTVSRADTLNTDDALQMTIAKLQEKVKQLHEEKNAYKVQLMTLNQSVDELHHQKEAKQVKLAVLEEKFQNMNSGHGSTGKNTFSWKASMGNHV